MTEARVSTGDLPLARSATLYRTARKLSGVNRRDQL